MSTTYTRILDIAAATLGFEPVSDPTRSEGRVVRLLSAQVVTVLEELIQLYDWADARVRYLPQRATLNVPLPPPYAHACPLPSGFLGVADASRPGTSWTVEWLDDGSGARRYLLLDREPDWIEIKQLPPPERIGPLLAKAAGSALAERCALQLVESGARRDAMLTRAQIALAEAIGAELPNRAPEVRLPSTWQDSMWR